MTPQLQLVAPSRTHLDAYTAALRTGWSPFAARDVSREHLDAISRDAEAFILDQNRVEGGVITLPDGSSRPRLPMKMRWMWDGDFCGAVNLRWQKGTDALPPYVAGHVGYTVVPWKRRMGHATAALGLILCEARSVGLGKVEITTHPDNEASRRIIEGHGGRFVEEFVNPHYGDRPQLRYTIDLAP
ncbi:MAG: GNAT family N-acetyltransferase [Bosea sp.]|jgi:predicted acetyltransferase|nr:GNAT family N-acetyltransferase [Bosea sp. (in: a-proteobacteria)]